MAHEHIFAGTKWPQFCRRHLQMNFSWMKTLVFFIRISLEFVYGGSVDNMLAMVQIMAWWRTGDKSLYQPIVTQFAEANMCRSLKWVNAYLITDSVLCRFATNPVLKFMLKHYWYNITEHHLTQLQPLGYHKLSSAIVIQEPLLLIDIDRNYGMDK